MAAAMVYRKVAGVNASVLATGRFRWLVIFTLAALAATAAACGGGENDDTTTPTATSESTGATSPAFTPGSSGTSPTSTSDSGGAAPRPTATSIPAAVSATGAVADVMAVLRPWLEEQVVRTGSTLTSNDTSSIGLNTTAVLVYEGDSPPIPDVARLQGGFAAFSGGMNPAPSPGGTASVVFDNAQIAGYLVSGTVTVAEVVTIFLLINS